MRVFSAMCESPNRLVGKTVIVTGCNTGIGKETVKDFYKRGAKVIMACRDTKKANEAKSHVEKSLSDKINMGKIIVKKLDLSSLKSVREFSNDILKEEAQINILVNNAGVMMCPLGKTEDGFETQFGTNHLGHFLLTLLLLPKIIKSAPARIVNVSSAAHTGGIGTIDFNDPNYEKRPYGPMEAYCQSKLANVLFTNELARKLKENKIEGVNCYSLHPGAIATDLTRHFDSLMFRGARTMIDFIARWLFKTPEQGAQTQIYCAVDDNCANETGLYYAECETKKPLPEAENIETAKKLWAMSLKSVKLENDYNPFV